MAPRDEIRILELLPGRKEDDIECGVRVAALSDSVQYEALSYVWGDRAGGKTVRVAGREVEVTDNLYAALRRLRRSSSKRALWIDQLCINQWDDSEKTEQVNVMRLIYKNCSHCLIWLGEIVEETAGFTALSAEATFDFIRLFADDRATDIPPTLSSPEAFQGAQNAFKGMILNGNPWWSRIWTVQEIVLPPMATVKWGPLSIPWQTLETAALNMCLGRFHIRLAPLLCQFSNLNDFIEPVRGLDIARRREPALDVLQRWRYREASDPRDKVYALMGLFPSMPFPSVQSCSYELSPAILYTRVTLDLIQLEEGLRPLVGRRGEPQVTAGLPTWALDLTRCKESKKRAWKWWDHSHRYKVFRADGNMPFQWDSLNDGSVLSLTGVFVDKIVEVGEILRDGTWDDLSDGQLIDTILDWEEILRQFVSRHSTYVWASSWGNAFWRTMLGDLVMREFPLCRARDTDYHKFIAFLKNRSRNEIYISLRDMVVNQAFFITESGHIGIGPPTLLARDEVWVLFGGQVPFVLRPKAKQIIGESKDIGLNDYVFVGDAFMYGFMDGEAVRYCEGKQDTILLY